jgi:acetyl-CoA carboxylase carboxyl transferase subunit alpha
MAGERKLSFERPIYELEARLEKLERLAQKNPEAQNEFRQLRRELTDTKRRIYASLKPWETVEVARHPDRPQTTDYLELVFDEFVELHGDKLFGDDRAIRTGWAKLDGHRVMVVGHQKGKTTSERIPCNYGCAHPEGYRKALRVMKLAEKFRLPVVTFIDTPGAYPGVGAEERGQFSAIAANLMEMARLRTPLMSVVIGEGGSGGALALAIGNYIIMLENSTYSVISPEGCAAILWKDPSGTKLAARALKLTSKDLYRLGIIDRIVHEPMGGAHNSPERMVKIIKKNIIAALKKLEDVPGETLKEERAEKFEKIGYFNNSASNK